MYKKNIYSLPPILSALLGFFSAGVSVAYLETGTYSSELMMNTGPTGATARYILSICGFLIVYFFVFNLIVNKKWINNQKKTINTNNNDEIFYKVVSLSALGFAISFLSCIPQQIVESRNLYLIDHPNLVRDLIFKYLPFIALYLGLAAGFTKKIFTKLIAYMSLFLILISIYFFGHKASALFSFICTFTISFLVISIPTLKKHSALKMLLKKEILIILVALVYLLSAGTVRYVNMANYDLPNYLSNRILCLQGGLWWATDLMKANSQSDLNFNNFMNYILSTNYTRNLSLIYLMEKAIGESLTYKIVSEHYNIYTGGFPASFYIFGTYGPIIFSCLTGLICAFACGLLVKRIIKRQYIVLLFYFYIYLYVIAIIESGEFVQIFTKKFAFYLSVVILAEYVRYKYSALSNKNSQQIQ